MAFYSSSSNYPYYYGNYTQIPFEPGYNNLTYNPYHQSQEIDSYSHSSHSNFNDPRYYYSPNDNSYSNSSSSVSCYSNEYQYAPTKSLVAYSTIPEDGGYGHGYNGYGSNYNYNLDQTYYYSHKNAVSPIQSVLYQSVAPPPPTDDLEFDEYDPEPYDGGYDIVRTYGKPLPPNDKICHPRSSSSTTTNPNGNALPFTPVMAPPNGPKPGVGTNGVVAETKKINDDGGGPKGGSEPKQQQEKEEDQLNGKDGKQGGLGAAGAVAAGAVAAGAIAAAAGKGTTNSSHGKEMSKGGNEHHESGDDDDDDYDENDDDDDDFYDDDDDEYLGDVETGVKPPKQDEQQTISVIKPPASAPKQDDVDETTTSIIEAPAPATQQQQDDAAKDAMREYGKKVYTMPPGYGLDSLDLCDGFFGYWPCLRKYEATTMGTGYDNGSGGQGNNNQVQQLADEWQMTADYLFGNLNPYAGH